MSQRSEWPMSEEDRVLWNLVARSTKPIRGAKLPKPDETATTPVASPKSKKEKEKQIITADPYQAMPKPPARASNHIDAQTREKLAKGRLPIEARVDLHGMRQDEAYSLLLSFVSRAQSRGARYVLVITGKGSSSGGDGVLRRSVPNWLQTAPFRAYVSSHEHAARGHGGAGALYIRLKRSRAA